MSNLYEINNEVNEILLNEELDEETLAKLDNLKWEATDKLENIAKYIRNLESDIKAFEEEEKFYKAKKTIAKNKIESLKKYTWWFLNAIWKDKFTAGNFNFNFRKSTSVNIIDEDKIWEDYTEIIETKKIDKMKLKEDLKNWKQIEWAKLIENKNLQIK